MRSIPTRRAMWLAFGLLATLSAAALSPATVSAAESDRADRKGAEGDDLRFFETAVRPILVERCHQCHGPEKQWAGLRLDSRARMLKGGDSGPALVPGNAEESLLMHAIRHDDDASPMPPEGDKLTDRQIADVARWIKAGAAFPEAAPMADDRKTTHWAFQPIADVAVPSVQDAGWPRTEIDRFILARLEAEGLRPAPEADRRTLLRRVTFDLTGLPPTPADVEAFLNDPAPGAYGRVVDRLLASPAYGERWGRHWLDVARYADSNGLDENVAQANAWRYRDYVVEAFNDDRPYDRFLAEQIAGDLLPADDEADRRRNLIATGFLVLGPKVLAEPDPAKMEMDLVDEQLDTLGRAVLGMTFGCARCHDHKFDPITAADYYALAGIFKSTKTMETFKIVARWNENVLPGDETRRRKAEHERKIAAVKAAIASLTAAADANPVAADSKTASKAEFKEESATTTPQAATAPEGAKAELKRLKDELAALEKTPPELPSAMGVAEGAVVDLAIHLRGDHLRLGDVVPRRVPAVFTEPAPPEFPKEHSGRAQLAEWIVDPAHPLTARVFVNRVWRWHFGEGLVRTPDNFGLLGEAPTHPELLDRLARRFVEGGWSVKTLHREIVLSSTYRQGDVCTPQTLERDPENRLFSRAAVRRLDAEEIRDAILFVSGRLDRGVGGSLLTVKNRDYFFNHTSQDHTEYSSRRRAIYLPVVRNNVYSLFQLLDFPDPAVSNGDRAATTIAPQALLMMNGDVVSDAAAALAESLMADPDADDAARLRRLYALTYAREPTAEEVAADRAFLREADRLLATEGDAARPRAWAALCQVVLAANEFIYLR